MPESKPRLVAAALLGLALVMATTLGAFDDVPTWARSLAQGLGTLAGVYLGWLLTREDDERSVQASAKTALANLYSLAASVQHMLAGVETARRRLANSPPPTVAAANNQAETLLDGVETQALVLLAQANAAAQAWLPYVDEAWLQEQQQREVSE